MIFEEIKWSINGDQPQIGSPVEIYMIGLLLCPFMSQWSCTFLFILWLSFVGLPAEYEWMFNGTPAQNLHQLLGVGQKRMTSHFLPVARYNLMYPQSYVNSTILSQSSDLHLYLMAE